jgi:hypothetical protein
MSHIHEVSRVYEGQSANRSQMDVKRKRVIFRPGKNNIHFSTYFLPTLKHLSHRFTSASNPQHRSFLILVSATSAPGRASSANFERP